MCCVIVYHCLCLAGDTTYAGLELGPGMQALAFICTAAAFSRAACCAFIEVGWLRTKSTEKWIKGPLILPALRTPTSPVHKHEI